MHMDINEAFILLLDPVREGGYTAGMNDPGGETKFGISKRSYPNEDIANLTRDRAKELYTDDFWGPAHCDEVPDAVRFDLFDAAVNCGPTQAIKFLQLAVSEVPDGRFGPRTITAITNFEPWRVAVRLGAQRQLFQSGLKNWPVAGKGWARRNAYNLLRL